ncbi:MAG: hypothetical protein KBONHNOK_00001 [Candidatus Methanoperedenaceae archaeon GB50]|nr:MAG: hypothetical protein KBONHNOK_00001 [Candidatus Methanoperedenaceae archaeon GB50]
MLWVFGGIGELFNSVTHALLYPPATNAPPAHSHSFSKGVVFEAPDARTLVVLSLFWEEADIQGWTPPISPEDRFF